MGRSFGFGVWIEPRNKRRRMRRARTGCSKLPTAWKFVEKGRAALRAFSTVPKNRDLRRAGRHGGGPRRSGDRFAPQFYKNRLIFSFFSGNISSRQILWKIIRTIEIFYLQKQFRTIPDRQNLPKFISRFPMTKKLIFVRVVSLTNTERLLRNWQKDNRRNRLTTACNYDIMKVRVALPFGGNMGVALGG